MNKLSLVIIGLCVLAVVSQDQPTDDQQFASMRRTACLVLSRYHSNTQKDTVQGIVQGLTPQLQQKYINRMYSTAVEICQPLINQSEVQELFVENKDFDPTHLFHLFETVDYSAVADTLKEPLTPNQESIVKFMKNFDEQMAIRQEEKEAQKSSQSGSQVNEIKILGISFSQMSGFSKFIYVALFSSIIIAFLFYGFKKLDDKQGQKKSNKRRKSPKKE